MRLWLAPVTQFNPCALFGLTMTIAEIKIKSSLYLDDMRLCQHLVALQRKQLNWIDIWLYVSVDKKSLIILETSH